MKKLLEKKQWMMISLVAALGVAVYLNYYFTKEPTLTAGTSANSGETVSSSEDAHLGEASYVNAPVTDVSKTESDTSDESEKPAAGEYFSNARASRTAAREESMRVLEEMVNNPQSSAEDKASATKKATAIADNILQESNIENLVLAKGFSDCVAFIDEDKCQVVVKRGDLQQQESMQILEIVLSQCSIPAANVQISSVAN